MNDNGTLMNMIQQMNNNFMTRLSSIESNVSKLNSIESDIQLIRSDMYKLQVENSQISKRISVVEKSCETISVLFDDSKTVNSNTQKEISNLKCENEKLKSNAAQNNEKCKLLSSEILDLKTRSMQQNLLFFGLAEGQDGVLDNTETKLRDFLKTELTLEDPRIIDTMEFDRLHRLGRPRRSRVSNPRPIVARFTRFKDRETIRNAAKELNSKRNGFNIREQFPPEMEETRKTLYPVMRRYQQNPDNRVVLVRDKLYVNGEQYIHPSKSENKTDYSYGQPVRQNDNLNPSSSRSSRGVRLNQRYSLETCNRFDVLSSEQSDPGLSTARAGKRVLSSPEQEDTLLKRYRDHDSTPMDSMIEESEDLSFSQPSALTNHTITNEPGPQPITHNNQTALNTCEPATNISQVNTQTVNAEVYCDISGASCATGQVNQSNGENAVRHEAPQ